MLENGEYDELVQQWFGDEVAESLSVAEGSEG